MMKVADAVACLAQSEAITTLRVELYLIPKNNQNNDISGKGYEGVNKEIIHSHFIPTP